MDLKPDEETGELTPKPTFNSETGEEEFTYFYPSETPRNKPICFKVPTAEYATANKSKIGNLKPNPETSTTTAAAILYLLPTVVFFYPILAIFTVSIEIILHVWAHRKNRKLKDENRYYQSPLHIICQEFCAACKEEKSKLKIHKLQEKRLDKIKKYGLEYVKRIVT